MLPDEPVHRPKVQIGVAAWLAAVAGSLKPTMETGQILFSSRPSKALRAIALSLLVLLPLASAQRSRTTADPQHFQYQRLVVPPVDAPAACAILDPGIFTHAAPSLKDLRIYATQPPQEIPYAITLSESQQTDTQSAGILNLKAAGNRLTFDLEMPSRPYTAVALDLEAQNFLASGFITGSMTPGSANATHLGTFTLFDLSGQRLSRDTTLHLQESRLPYLHIVMEFASASGAASLPVQPQVLRAASVPPSREAQSLYTTALQSSEITQQGTRSLVLFHLPARVPVERVAFLINPDFHANFSRPVHISAHPDDASASSPSEEADGTILRVHLDRGGNVIDHQLLSVPVIIGSNLQSGATVQVALDNAGEAPLPLAAILLQMRQRKLCFPTGSTDAATRPLTLFYGDPHLSAPHFDLARVAAATSRAATITLGPEQRNTQYHPRTDTRSLTERQPDALWIALLAVIGLLAIVAFRAIRKHHPHHH